MRRFVAAERLAQPRSPLLSAHPEPVGLAETAADDLAVHECFLPDIERHEVKAERIRQLETNAMKKLRAALPTPA